jgi:hypothetical protein
MYRWRRREVSLVPLRFFTPLRTEPLVKAASRVRPVT